MCTSNKHKHPKSARATNIVGRGVKVSPDSNKAELVFHKMFTCWMTNHYSCNMYFLRLFFTVKKNVTSAKQVCIS